MNKRLLVTTPTVGDQIAIMQWCREQGIPALSCGITLEASGAITLTKMVGTKLHRDFAVSASFKEQPTHMGFSPLIVREQDAAVVAIYHGGVTSSWDNAFELYLNSSR